MCSERSVQISDNELRETLKRLTEEIIKSGPKEALLTKRSRVSAALGLWEHSKLDAWQAVELNPSSLVANYRLSVALLQLGQPSEALKFAGNALKLSPRHPQLQACLHAILDSLECANEETKTHLEQPRCAEKDEQADVRRTLEDGAHDKTSTGGGSPQTWDKREYLDMLGLQKDPAIVDIRRAYLERVGSVHPDKGGSAEDFAKLRQAYETLLTSATARGCIPESALATEDRDCRGLCSQGGESVGHQLPCTADQVTEEAYWQFQRDTAALSHEKGRRFYDAGMLAHSSVYVQTKNRTEAKCGTEGNLQIRTDLIA